MAENDVLETARERFKLCREVEEKQREREIDDLRFQVPELQWTDAEKKARAGRPTLSISKLDQPRSLVLNQMRQADLGVQISPVSETADEETAEMLQGLYRHIERKSRAELARYWAFDRALSAGRGAYRVLTEYDDETDNPSDQRIVIKRILHQDAVYFDPAATEPDFCDGRFAFVCSWLSRDEFKKLYKGKSPATKLEWQGVEKEAPEWVRDDDVLVAEYWTREETVTKRKVAGKTLDRSEVKVTCRKLCGWDVLETEEWPGKYIPLIPVIGREVQPFDEERRWVGMIGPAKGGQQLYNYAASTLVERLSLEPKAPFVAAAEATEGYEDFWKTANEKNYPVLLFNAFMKGNPNAPLPRPERAQIDGSGMSLALMALQEADQFIQATTAVFDPSLGRMPQKDRSGRAILALQQQADAGTSGYLQNLADVSMTYEAKVVLDLIPKIYDRPGRITRILHGDDRKSSPVMLGQPYVMGKNKMPQAVAKGTPQAKFYDLQSGVYDVAVTVGKSFQTRLQEGSERIGELLAAKPELFMMMGDLFLKFQKWPGSEEMAKRMAKVREKTFPGLGESEDGQPTPEEMMARIQALMQENGMLKAAAQAMDQDIKTDKAKQEATVAKAQMDSQTTLQKAEMDNAVKMQIAELEARVDMLIAQMKAQLDAAKAQNAERESERDREEGRSEAERGRRHEATMTEINRAEPEAPERPEGMDGR